MNAMGSAVGTKCKINASEAKPQSEAEKLKEMFALTGCTFTCTSIAKRSAYKQLLGFVLGHLT